MHFANWSAYFANWSADQGRAFWILPAMLSYSLMSPFLATLDNGRQICLFWQSFKGLQNTDGSWHPHAFNERHSRGSTELIITLTNKDCSPQLRPALYACSRVGRILDHAVKSKPVVIPSSADKRARRDYTFLNTACP